MYNAAVLKSGPFLESIAVWCINRYIQILRQKADSMHCIPSGTDSTNGSNS
jgi:hypothetical protein